MALKLPCHSPYDKSTGEQRSFDQHCQYLIHAPGCKVACVALFSSMPCTICPRESRLSAANVSTSR
eukprot:5507620-Amphidinium_carterae.1